MTRIIWLDTDQARDMPHVVTSSKDCEMVVAVKDGKETRYSIAGYTAVHARPATAAEVEAWREQVWG